jgi:uncharacterized protein
VTVGPTPASVGIDESRIRRYLALVLSLGIPLLAIPAIADLPIEPFLLVVTYVLLLGGAIAVAHRTGPGGIRRLFRGALQWRIGWRNWALAVAVIPTATVTVALVTGTYTAPPDGWAVVLGSYLLFTFVVGALFLNVFEETAWQGLVQRHLARRHGPLQAALLTAIPFAALHLPLSLVGDVTVGEAVVAAALIVVMAPAMRYVMGRTDHRTGGSLLAVGITHASFNASGQLEVASGGWQHIVGLALIAAVFLVIDARRRPTRAETAPTGRPPTGSEADADLPSSRRDGSPPAGGTRDAGDRRGRARPHLQRSGL